MTDRSEEKPDRGRQVETPVAAAAVGDEGRKGPLVAGCGCRRRGGRRIGCGIRLCGRSRAMRAIRPAAPALDLARRIEPLTQGEVAAVRLAEDARKLPVLAFRDADGQPKIARRLARPYRAVNLWATWCVPCRKEMPALDALQDKLGVAAVRGGGGQHRHPRSGQAAATGCATSGSRHLAYYSDANAKVFQDLKTVGKAIGMPTTLLVDPNGCEIASLSGPAEWASADGVKLISAALANR